MENRNSIFAEVLELLGNFLFEYNYAENVINFYVVANGKEVLARRITDFSDWKEDFEKEHVEEKTRAAFRVMCESIIAGKPINTAFTTDFFTSKGEFVEYYLVGRKYSGEDKMDAYIGYITTAQKSDAENARRMLGVEFVKDAGVDVYNKRSILEYCKHIIEENPGKSFYVAIFDLDNFKNINDNFGHFFGDEVLTRISGVIKETVSDYGKVGRVGGDEFFVVFDKVTDREEMRRIMKKTREQVEAAYKGKTGDYPLTCSAGACAYPECGDNFEDIYKVADALLYLAKEKGRNRYILFKEDLHRDLVNRVLNVKDEGNMADIYEEMAAQWNPTSIMERVISEYFISGRMSLEELLMIVENRFMVDYVQINVPAKGIRTVRVNSKNVDAGPHVDDIVIDNSLFSEFKGLNYFRANTITSFHDADSRLKELMKKNKVQTAIFYKVMVDDAAAGYIMFGKYQDNRKFAEQDCIVLTSVLQLISYKL